MTVIASASEGCYVRCPSMVLDPETAELVVAHEHRESVEDSGDITIRLKRLSPFGVTLEDRCIASGGSNMNPTMLDATTLLYRKSQPDVEEFAAIRDGRTGWGRHRVWHDGIDEPCMFDGEPMYSIVSQGATVHNGAPHVALVTVAEPIPDLDVSHRPGMIPSIMQIGGRYEAIVYRARSMTQWEAVGGLGPGTNETALASDGAKILYSARSPMYRGVRLFGVVGGNDWWSDLPCPGVSGSLIHDGEWFWACHPANSSERRRLSLWRSKDGVEWELARVIFPGWSGYSSIVDIGDFIAVAFEAAGCKELWFDLVRKGSKETFYPDLRAAPHKQYPGCKKEGG